jgi:hypothetical protein
LIDGRSFEAKARADGFQVLEKDGELEVRSGAMLAQWFCNIEHDGRVVTRKCFSSVD